ncbi:type 2 isopentenyl-diphosphate Delta-isomerase [Weissella diestrammenae]|uniref:Isopentenyl-diphosphate delta-isomerase n=1 Tax=Weissella diestrammenae TaxID=1162633 RepID=A0A7G9T4M2_9LACO|nr:type 2 isopentenyl-diphosphate Delta-isomerase [Weissella diestrammenae]MCM0582076.1 type 2 isopentenyl-diphosphate Delta-isomerase [Weissella diestrammenae]QNN75047.1 type 2 isopentenyl-diphosphate Delta-isomerase [Weissella diestrammenae]
MESAHAHRKDEHLAVAEAEYRKEPAISSLNQVRLIHRSLPETALNQVSLTVDDNNFPLSSPFYIEAMTGGSQKTGLINEQLSQVAKETNIAMAVGSQSIALKEFDTIATFENVRKINPDGFIIANLGAGHTAYEAQRVVDMIGANALEVHVNVTQEIVMPEGDQNFIWLESLGEIITTSAVPVIIKEVGFGMDQTTIQQLEQIGAKYINLGGRSGTNFAKIEDRRNRSLSVEQPYQFLYDWGQTTAESLLEARYAHASIIATGGIQTPLDILKAQVLGAKAVGVAGHFLHTLLSKDVDALIAEVTLWQDQLRQLYAMVGAKQASDLTQVPYILSPELYNYAQQRHLIN